MAGEVPVLMPVGVGPTLAGVGERGAVVGVVGGGGPLGQRDN